MFNTLMLPLFVALSLLIDSTVCFARVKDLDNFEGVNLTDILSDDSGNLYLATSYQGLFKSTDFGNSWNLTNSLTKEYHISCIAYDEYEGIFFGTYEYDILQSSDEGNTWRNRSINDDPGGYPQLIDIAITDKNYKILGAPKYYYLSLDNIHTISNGYLRTSEIGIAPDGTLYACGDSIMRSDSIILMKNTFVSVNLDKNIFTNCIEFDDENNVYAGTEKGIYFSDDRGENWRLLSSAIEDYGISDIYIDNKIIIIGTDSSGLLRSTDQGISWAEIEDPIIESRINKLYEFQNYLFALTEEDGIYRSEDNGKTWYIPDYTINNEADSLFADGWMPCINFYDQYPMAGRITFVDFIDNDSLIVAGIFNKDLYGGDFFIYDAKTGALNFKYDFPDTLNTYRFKFINLDSVLIVSETDKYYFGLFSFHTNEFKSYFSLTDEYFKEKPVYYRNYHSTIINSLIPDFSENRMIIQYTVRVFIYNYIDYFPFTEIRDINTGKLIKDFDEHVVFTNDMQYFLSENTKLYDYNGYLIYDIRTIPGNNKFIHNTNIVSAKISPDNKFIVLYDNERQFLVVDFETGKIDHQIPDHREIYGYGFSYDDNYFFTTSDESRIRVYNLNNINDMFDQVIFWPGESKWTHAMAKNSAAIVFGGRDGILRLWKPDLTFTSVDDYFNSIKIDEINIYPNPAADFIIIEDIPATGIEIYSMLGTKVRELETAGQRIDVSFLKPGIYFVRAGNHFYKFIKL